ncbi:AGL057Wp [Eremothecium gossypii ATCC 10895]|uniref:Isocitrate lyase n=1 Tax=Eremothecium gossypii (strain ATCC 10895 / CBS 109.51 / FGSC 9923 / NRRL Y-1056) TaxID=284811 RepID=Q750K8_EREGS|nr:AGL057Wp [Eremothecium gossypii ATCC 10895]AAS54433.2 AGL057Wp [Eremothecium gossypii ATCC 10895]AEY98765.1 FAGL057Wp [Eremothecium gossypii FDAG1]
MASVWRRSLKTLSSYPRPSGSSAKRFVEEQTTELEQLWSSPRFQEITRPYTPLDVVKHRGSLGRVGYASSVQAERLHDLLEDKFHKREAVSTLGVIDPVQMTQLARCEGIEAAYVSGWACSSTMVGSTNEVSPDFGDYPYDTVPNQVERIFRAQQMHDRKAFLADGAEGRASTDYLKPIIADGDMGHGGSTTVMKLAKLFAEKGAAAIHLEDQMHGGKRCGHLGGAVLAPTYVHISRLIATRLQWDIMGTQNLLIARTDSANAKLIASSSDPRDHEFILGTTQPAAQPWAELVLDMEAAGCTAQEIAAAEQEWFDECPLLTFDQAAEQQLSSSEYGAYGARKKELCSQLGRPYLALREMRHIAEAVAPHKSVNFDWDAPRTREGHHMLHGCMELAVRRTLAFAPYSDLLWLETKTPDLRQASAFAAAIHRAYPHAKLVYNLSPSFNWTAHGYDDRQLRAFIPSLAAAGFVLQLVSLAGLHSDALAFWQLAAAFPADGMLAYVQHVQAPERRSGCDVLLHQRWSGVDYVDSLGNLVQNGASSHTRGAGGDSFTESQFQ